MIGIRFFVNSTFSISVIIIINYKHYHIVLYIICISLL